MLNLSTGEKVFDYLPIPVGAARTVKEADAIYHKDHDGIAVRVKMPTDLAPKRINEILQFQGRSGTSSVDGDVKTLLTRTCKGMDRWREKMTQDQRVEHAIKGMFDAWLMMGSFHNWSARCYDAESCPDFGLDSLIDGTPTYL